MDEIEFLQGHFFLIFFPFGQQAQYVLGLLVQMEPSKLKALLMAEHINGNTSALMSSQNSVSRFQPDYIERISLSTYNPCLKLKVPSKQQTKDIIIRTLSKLPIFHLLAWPWLSYLNKNNNQHFSFIFFLSKNLGQYLRMQVLSYVLYQCGLLLPWAFVKTFHNS